MVEQKLVAVDNVGKDGKTYTNFNLKSNPLKGRVGINAGDYIIVKKLFAEGMVLPQGRFPGSQYSCKVEHNGKEGSFILNEKEHAVYKTVGGVGDSVKITLTKEPFINKVSGVETLLQKLKFELV